MSDEAVFAGAEFAGLVYAATESEARAFLALAGSRWSAPIKGPSGVILRVYVAVSISAWWTCEASGAAMVYYKTRKTWENFVLHALGFRQ